jgi:hypothetical protein
MWSLVFALVLMAAAAISGVSAQQDTAPNLNAFEGSCSTDDDVPESDRALYEKTAMRFIGNLLGDKPETAHADLVDELQEKLPVPDFVRATEGARSNPQITELHIVHSYLLSQTTFGSDPVTIPCLASNHGPGFGAPEGRVDLLARPVPRQAFIIIEGQIRKDREAFILWLLPQQDGWRIGYYTSSKITILAKTSTDIWNLAREEQKRGHALISYLLYDTALKLADHGPNLQLGIRSEIIKEMLGLERPTEFQGAPPYTWTFDKVAYHVAAISPIAVGGAFNLIIAHNVEQTSDSQELERQNRAFINSFEEAHPEFESVFDGLVVQAVTPNGVRFGTVDQKRGGHQAGVP